MILIADSGSTKTEWRVLTENHHSASILTQGLSPYYQSTETISQTVAAELLPHIQLQLTNIKEVFFYGTGCSNPTQVNLVKNALLPHFPSAEITVNHDLLASARAACGHHAGIAAILGTGSNSCLFDGENILDNVPSLGLYLGDEGSGGHIGKKIIQAYLYRELPEDVAKLFYHEYHTNKDEILEHIYKKPLPNRYLAGFSRFAANYMEQYPYLEGLVKQSFREFFTSHILKYNTSPAIPFNCVGSIGFYYQKQLREVAAEYGIPVGQIFESPMAGLTLYHAQQ